MLLFWQLFLDMEGSMLEDALELRPGVSVQPESRLGVMAHPPESRPGVMAQLEESRPVQVLDNLPGVSVQPDG